MSALAKVLAEQLQLGQDLTSNHSTDGQGPGQGQADPSSQNVFWANRVSMVLSLLRQFALGVPADKQGESSGSPLDQSWAGAGAEAGAHGGAEAEAGALAGASGLSQTGALTAPPASAPAAAAAHAAQALQHPSSALATASLPNVTGPPTVPPATAPGVRLRPTAAAFVMPAASGVLPTASMSATAPAWSPPAPFYAAVPAWTPQVPPVHEWDADGGQGDRDWEWEEWPGGEQEVGAEFGSWPAGNLWEGQEEVRWEEDAWKGQGWGAQEVGGAEEGWAVESEQGWGAPSSVLSGGSVEGKGDWEPVKLLTYMFPQIAVDMLTE